MVSATFGEKINTDKIVLDKTAREAIAELYPEACAKHPKFLGKLEGFLLAVDCCSRTRPDLHLNLESDHLAVQPRAGARQELEVAADCCLILPITYSLLLQVVSILLP